MLVKQQRKAKKTRRGKNAKGNLGPRAHITRAIFPKLQLPPRMEIRCEYNVLGALNNVGFQYSSVRYNPCYAYDVDPLVLSTAQPGYTELAALYRYVRCIRSTIVLEFANNETNAGMVYTIPVNTDPGSNSALYQNFLSSVSCKKALVSAKGGMDRRKVICSTSTELVGGAAYLGVQDFYTQNTVTHVAPSNAWYWQVGCLMFNPIVNNVIVDVTITTDYVFFELANPSS